MFVNKNVEALWLDIQGFSERHKNAAKVVLEKLDTEGDISSIVMFKWSKSPYVKVNVRDHTIGVVREAMKLEKPHMLMYPLLVLAALGHDVGKLPCGNLDRRPEEYVKRKHAEESAKLCKRWFRQFLKPHHLDLVIASIEEHHDELDDYTLVELLTKADKTARFIELMAMEGADLRGRRMIPVGLEPPGASEPRAGLPKKRPLDPDSERLSFFTVAEFLKRLEPHLNSAGAYTHLGPEAFTMSARTYVTTYSVFKVIREWAHQMGCGAEIEKVADYNAYPGRWDNLIAYVGGKLREANALTEKDLPNKSYTYRKFVVTDGHGKMKDKEGMFFMPIKTKVFSEGIRALENRKKGSLFADIVKVQPDFRVWSKRKEVLNG